MEQLKAIFKEVAAGICSWFGADDTKQVEDKEIYEALDYLEEMGYDIKGYGFLTGYKEESDVDASKNEKYDKDIGVIRDEGDKIVKADSDFIYAYLVSDNYVYTVANKNLVTQNGEGFWSKVWGGIKATAVHFYDFFGGETPNDWTRGLINIWEEEQIGVRGKFFSDTGFLNFDNIEIDPQGKTLTLKKSELFNMNGSIKYSLDGWTGRYGMPLEFLLSVHVATMMPDLAYDMANTFHTKINLLLHEVTDAIVTAAFKEGNNYITYEYIDSICGGFGFDSAFTTAKEAMKVMKELGIKSPSNCTGFDSEGVGTEDVDTSTKINNKGTDEFNEVLTKMKELGYNGDELPTSASSGLDFDSYLTDVTDKKNEKYNADDEIVDTISECYYYQYYYSGEKLVSWTGEYNGESCTYSVTMNIDHYKQTSTYKMLYQGEHMPPKYSKKECDDEVLNISCSKITRGWTETEWEDAVADAKEGKTDEELANLTNQDLLGITKCSSSPEGTEKCCETCRLYIKKIYDTLKSPQDADFDYYIPYIENVVDHWYRDVFFTSTYYDSDNNKIDNATINFVDYDYDYEAVMNERWTKYETDENTGEYKLYAIDKNGKYATNSNQIEKYSEDLFEKDGIYYIFKGTQEEATKQEIAVSKKAETLTTSDTEKLEDLGWNNDADENVWSAYKRDGETVTDWEQTYPDADTSTLEGQVKSQIYTKISSNQNLVQEGEGQRAETNQKIKKMFLNNKYLKYDGTPERAEEITKLRKDKNIEYGAITTTDEEVQKYTSKVALNQDALNAFNMLENTHTLDADYIYRDFKELIVELGYFTKEELTDETPRLLQWLVPVIGSGGYPDRTIDKNENEFGTMVHSKGDIDANKKNTIQEMVKKIQKAKSEENQSKDANQYPTSGHFDNTEIKATTSVGANLTSVGSIEQASKKPEEVSVEEFLTAAEEVHKVIEELQFQYCWGAGNSHKSDMPHTDGHGCAGLFNTLEEASASNGHRIDCSTYVSYVLQAVGLMQGRTYTGSKGGDGLYGLFSEYVITREAAGELQPGDILISDTHTQINGEDHIQYNAGSGEAIRGEPEVDENPSFYTDVIRLPFSNSKKSTDSYQGYMGNEAVVSPVTGILLDYGTYDDDDKSSITGEKYRQNIDLKYAKEIKDDKGQNSNNTNPNNGGNNKSIINLEYDSEKPDKVGYAKILVLDAESYKKLESKTENPWKNESLVKMNTKTDEEGNKEYNVKYLESKDDWVLDKEDRLKDKNDDGNDDDPWTELEKTVYGYKEFAERYEIAGLSGYVVYIDGFKCEKPDEDFTEEQLESKIPNEGKEEEQKLTIEDFQKITEGDLSGTDLPDEEKVMPSHYEKDVTHKMASKKATEKAKAEAQVKSEASSTICIDIDGEKLTFIKEGTLLGRTITDFELIEGKDYRNESGGYEKYRKKNDTNTTTTPTEPNTTQTTPNDEEEEENENPVIGNYLRIIMKDTDDTVVENVEDYMKLGESSGFNAVSQEYKAWEGDAEALAEAFRHESGGWENYLVKYNVYGEKEAEFNGYCMGYSAVNKVIPANKDTHYGKLYDESRTDLSPLVQVLTNQISTWYGDPIPAEVMKVHNGGKGCYSAKDFEFAEYCLTYDCTSVTKPFDTKIGSDAASDGYTATAQGTVIPQAMCQQGGYGDGASGQSGIILVGYEDIDSPKGEFGKGDELFGVDRMYENRIK